MKRKEMSFREEGGGGSGGEDGRDLRKPFIHTGSWYRMGSRQSSSIISSSSQVLRDGSVSVVLCVLIVALGPIQFGYTVHTSYFLLKFFPFFFLSQSLIVVTEFFFFWFVWLQCGYSSPTQSAIIKDLKLSISEVWI